MHKSPPGMRFISSSKSGSVKTISVRMNRLLRELLPDVDALFADCAATLGVSAEWASKSWVLKNTTGMIPLIHAWNAGYAERAGAMPFMEAWDFERLYTHVPLHDLKDSIMHIMTLIFQSDRRKNNPAFEVRAKKHGFWMPAGRAPAQSIPRYGEDTQGECFIYDLANIAEHLQFLLNNIYVKFGGRLFLQGIGVPMGTKCASMLAHIYLARYELVFLQNLARVMHTYPPDSQLHVTAQRVSHAFTLTRSCRYIDDLGSINNPYLRHLLYNNVVFYDQIHGIYPSCLTLKLVQRGASIDYTDITIGPSGKGYMLTTVCFVKREHPPLSPLFIVSLPHASSQILIPPNTESSPANCTGSHATFYSGATLCSGWRDCL